MCVCVAHREGGGLPNVIPCKRKCKKEKRKKKLIDDESCFGWDDFTFTDSLVCNFSVSFPPHPFFVEALQKQTKKKNFSQFSVGLILTRVKLYAFDNLAFWIFRPVLKCLFVRHQSLPLSCCCNGAALERSGRCPVVGHPPPHRRGSSLTASHRVTDVHLPLLEFLLYFQMYLWFYCSL